MQFVLSQCVAVLVLDDKRLKLVKLVVNRPLLNRIPNSPEPQPAIHGTLSQFSINWEILHTQKNIYTKTQSVFKLPSVQSNHSCTRKPARLQHFTFLQCSSEFTNIFKLTKFWKCQKFSALKTNLIMKISNRKSQINCTALCTCYLLTSLLTLYSSIHFSWLLLICQHPIIFTTPGRPPSNAPQVRALGVGDGHR